MTFTGQVPLDLDFIEPQRFSMLGAAGLAEAVFGTGTTVDGLAVVPTAPTSLAVAVSPGQIYQTASLDAQAYGSLDKDTAHQVVKQGVLRDAQQLPIQPPSTPGTSQVFLIQAAFQEVDAGATVLPYYNSQNPTQAFSGPGNSGAQQYTRREGRVAVQIKAGTPANTGSQVAPTPDVGWVGLALVTVAANSAVINSSNIVRYPGPHWIAKKLPQLGRAAAGAVTVVTGARTLTAADAGLVVLDVGSWLDGVTVTLPKISEAPGEPVRFEFVGRYITPRSRRQLSWAWIVPQSGDKLDENQIYCGPNDTVRLCSDGTGRWIWEGSRQQDAVVLQAAATQAVPSGVATAIQWQTPPATVMPGWWTASSPSILTVHTYIRLRVIACVTFLPQAPGTRSAYVLYNGQPALAPGWPWSSGPGRADALGTSLNLVGGPVGAFDGDTIQIVAQQDSGVPVNIDPGRTWLHIETMA